MRKGIGEKKRLRKNARRKFHSSPPISTQLLVLCTASASECGGINQAVGKKFR